MFRSKRVGILSLVGVLSAPVIVAGMAWACGPSGYGVPEKPAAPPQSTAAPVAAAPTAPPTASPAPATAPAATPAKDPVPSAGTSETGSATTRGADTRSGNSGSGTAGSDNTGSGSFGSSGGGSGASGQAAIDARVAGSTAGVVERGDQRVFRSSTAPDKSKAGSPARAGSVSATEDLWSASPSPRANSSLAAAGEETGGLSSAMVAGIIVLSLGLLGIIGGVLVAETRRRRAEGFTDKR